MFQKLLFIILLFISSISFSQSQEMEERIAKQQAVGIVKANEYLRNNDLPNAMAIYGTFKSRDSTTLIGKFSKDKIDSLKPIFRGNLKNELQGFWK